MSTVVLLGAGRIARVHCAALGEFADLHVIGAVDPAPLSPLLFRGREVPTVASLDLVSSAFGDPDLIVIATPSRSHVDDIEAVLGLLSSRLLVEKPVAGSLQQLERLRALGSDDLEGRVMVCHHFAFAPEVEWLALQMMLDAELGRPSRVQSTFFDPYAQRMTEAVSSYTSAWTDSGINQLSILSRLLPTSRIVVDSLAGDETTALASVSCSVDEGDIPASLFATWRATSSSKASTIEFADDLEILLDHTAMSAVVRRHGKIEDWFVCADQLPRQVVHYQGIYRALLAGDEHALSLSTAVELAHLLHSARRGAM